MLFQRDRALSIVAGQSIIGLSKVQADFTGAK